MNLKVNAKFDSHFASLCYMQRYEIGDKGNGQATLVAAASLPEIK